VNRSTLRLPWAALALCVFGATAARGTTLYTLTIQPIQVCLDNGTQCADPTQQLYEAAGDKIWAQAGIDLAFLPFTTYNNTNFWNFDSTTDMPTPSLLSVIQLYFVPDIDDTVGLYGIGWVGGNGVVVSDDIFDVGRLDTIAHELGHNLGLDHTAPLCLPTSLMASGSCRLAPANVGDIAPDGAALDQLSASEISTAVTTGHSHGWLQDTAVPEPSTVLLSIGGLVLVGLRKRRGVNCFFPRMFVCKLALGSHASANFSSGGILRGSLSRAKRTARRHR
jgi:hypothetical protein